MRSSSKNWCWLALSFTLIGGCGGGGGSGYYAYPTEDAGATDLGGGGDQAMPLAGMDLALPAGPVDLAEPWEPRDLAEPWAPRDLAKPPDLAPPLPKAVEIHVVGATVAPFKSDATKWDGLGTVGQKLVNDLLAALAEFVPYGAVIKFLGNAAVAAAVSGFDKPDPFGTAEIRSAKMWQLRINLSTDANNVEDTFTPLWKGPPQPPGWIHVPLEPDLRLRVTVWDEDQLNDDVIGTAEIPYDAILRALNSKAVEQIEVAGQTNNQLLFVGISVTAE